MQENKQEKSPIKQNILLYLEKKGITQYEFYKTTGVTRGVLGQNNGISEDNLARFLAHFNDVNIEWLLTGKGEMLKSDIFPINDATDAIPFMPESANMGKPIPLVHQFAAAGFGNTDFSIGEQDVKEYYVIPKFKYSKVDFMIEVTGMSMYPHYTPGDVVACSILHDSQFIQWNKCHVLATLEQGIIVKRLKKGNASDHIIAVSDNKEYDPFPVPFNEITGMALVIGSVRIE